MNKDAGRTSLLAGISSRGENGRCHLPRAPSDGPQPFDLLPVATVADLLERAVQGTCAVARRTRGGKRCESEFISASFQNFAVFPFVLLGTVMVLVGVAERFRGGWIPAVLVAVLVTLVAVSYGYETSPATVRATIAGVAPGEAAALRTALARTPSDAEVIATIGIMGRFCGRQYCYYFASGLGRPVHSNTVVFVFAAGKTLSTPGGIGRAIAYVEDDLHAQVLVDSDGVTACLWRPPPHTTQVTVPTGAPPSGALDIPRHGRSAGQRSALPGQARGS